MLSKLLLSKRYRAIKIWYNPSNKFINVKNKIWAHQKYQENDIISREIISNPDEFKNMNQDLKYLKMNNLEADADLDVKSINNAGKEAPKTRGDWNNFYAKESHKDKVDISKGSPVEKAYMGKEDVKAK